MQQFSLPTLVIAATLAVSTTGAFANETGCLAPSDMEGQPARVPDCIRMGRHVRVGPSVSRGTAALHDGVVPAALGADDAGPRRVYVPMGLGSLFPGLFGR